SAQDLAAERGTNPQLLLLDVREPFEHDIAAIAGSLLIPLAELPGRLRELDGHAAIVAYCHHGVRSAHARDILLAAGFGNVRNLAGGIDAWARAVDPTLPRY
ncbi:MAG TPA: rhodanese-like domain-containing protein, partial [Ktedonobacterales bacterium]|nr:rhodanese-like domain-containing protein [Ktedonobacterales bacterium]